MTSFILVLVLVMVVTCAIGVRVHGPFSFVSAGLVGLAAYSVPALLGLVYPFHFVLSSREAPLIAASTDTIAVTAAAWSAVLFSIAPPPRKHIAEKPSLATDRKMRLSIITLLTLCLTGLTFIIVQDGALFFLDSRDAQTQSAIRLLWRWTPAIGLLLAISVRNYKLSLLFLICLTVIFISGDRTIVIITLIGVIVILGRGSNALKFLIRPSGLVAICVTGLIAFFGKPIYLSAKARTLDPFFYSISPEGIEQVLKAYEPFTVANTLDLVVATDLSLPAWLLLEGLIGQLLIIPSAFGIDANSFNTAITAAFASTLTYGIAGNFWAQAYAIGGYLGVLIFGIIYGLLLRLADYGSLHYVGAAKGGWMIFGALVAVYAHRNGLDNLASFARQIAIVTIVVLIITRLLSARTRSPRPVGMQHLSPRAPRAVHDR